MAPVWDEVGHGRFEESVTADSSETRIVGVPNCKVRRTTVLLDVPGIRLECGAVGNEGGAEQGA